MFENSSLEPDEIIGQTEDGQPITRRFIRTLLRCGYAGTAEYFLSSYCPGFTLQDF